MGLKAAEITTKKKAPGITNPPAKRLYDLKSAALYLGRPTWGMRQLIWAGKLPVVRDGKKQYVDIVDMDRYIERNKTLVTWLSIPIVTILRLKQAEIGH